MKDAIRIEPMRDEDWAAVRAIYVQGIETGLATFEHQAGIFPDNPASLALHERFGFRRVGVRERIGRDVTGRWRDVILLERRSSKAGAE